MYITQLQMIFNRFNAAHFAGWLPQFSVRKDFKCGDLAWCDIRHQAVRLPDGTRDVRTVVLRGILHIVTGGKYDDRFRAELRRIATLRDGAARRESAREE